MNIHEKSRHGDSIMSADRKLALQEWPESTLDGTSEGTVFTVAKLK